MRGNEKDVLSGRVASAPARAGPPHAGSSVVYISVVFISFPEREGTLAGNVTWELLQGGGTWDMSATGKKEEGGG